MTLLLLLILTAGDAGTHAAKVAAAPPKSKPMLISPPDQPDYFEREIVCANGAVPRLDYRDAHSLLVCDLRPVVTPPLPGAR